MEKQDRSRKSRWGILNDEQMKVVEILSSHEPAIGYQMLKQFTRGSIAMILDKTVFQHVGGYATVERKPYSLPVMGCRFLVFISLFSLDVQHCTFSSTHLSMEGLWAQITIDPNDWYKKPDKDGKLIWFIFDYRRGFCESLGIERISYPV